jgi:multimeric flavodoxin WrbA
MGKRLIVHDVPHGLADGVAGEDDTVFAAIPAVPPCTGCYGCWIVTPGACVSGGRARGFAGLMGSHDELVVVSRLVYGGFSPEVKAVIDHSIGYLLPFFGIERDETRHPIRYPNALSLRYVFYGREPDVREIELARELASANAVNTRAKSFETAFFATPEEAVEALRP